MLEKYIEIEKELIVHYLQWGENPIDVSEPLVLLLHGFGSTAYAWVELAEILIEKYCVIAVDLPGHGKSSSLPNYTMKQFTDWMEGFIQKVCAGRKLVAIGHSIGADLLLHYVDAHPSALNRIILMDGGYLSNRLDLKTSLEETVNGALEFHANYQFADWKEFIHSESTHSSRWNVRLETAARKKMINDEEGVRLRISSETVKRYLSLFYENEGVSLLNRTALPILLLVSTLPKEANGMRNRALDRIDNMDIDVVKIQDAGHDVFIDNLPAVVEETMATLNRDKY